jgi:diguanylate cyclase (GGDEF)-like protein/PAS domain S-box-containing protein
MRLSIARGSSGVSNCGPDRDAEVLTQDAAPARWAGDSARRGRGGQPWRTHVVFPSVAVMPPPRKTPTKAKQPKQSRRPSAASGDRGSVADRRHEAFLEALFTRVPNAIAVVDGAGRFVRTNPGFQALLGFTPDDVLGRSLVDLIVPPSRRAAALEIQARVRRGETVVTETERRRKDGSLVTVQVSIANVDADGEPRVLFLYTDLTAIRDAEAALHAAQDRLEHVVASSTAVIYATKVEGDTFIPVWVSGNLVRLTGHDAHAALGPAWWADHVHPDDRARVFAAIPRLLSEDHLATEYRFQANDGAYRWIHDESRLMRDAAGQPLEVIGAWLDITDRKLAEEAMREAQSALRASEGELRALVGAMSDVIVVLDGEGRYAKIASSGADARHRPPAEWLGRRLHDVLPSEHATMVQNCVSRALEAHQPVDMEYSVDIDGDTVWIAGTVSPMTDDSVVWVARDITARKALEAQLAYDALHDPLTGLANRALFHDRVAHALARAGRTAGRIAVLFLDVDEFKTVNDSLGHGHGDQLLATLAHRLLNATRGCDTVARLGGDEFAVLLENAGTDADAIIVAERIAASLLPPFTLGEQQMSVSASIGIAQTTDGDTTETLLRNADVAMYRAKGEGKGRHAIFEPTMHQALVDRIALETDLRNGIERGELFLVYQPIVELDTGRITAIEALVRWAHPQRGTLPPALFIPLAEATGLIVPLGRFVLREACRQAAHWQDTAASGGGPAVTVNLSARQFQQDDLAADVAAALQDSALDPGRLVIEITESVVTRDIEVAIRQLHALKALGVQLAIDDFGTGYSSLSSLQRFPIDILKIDKSFIDGVTGAGNDAALARTIIALGDVLHMRTVAEGIEYQDQQQLVHALGCQLGQGYLFAKPVSAQEIGRIMHDQLGPSGDQADQGAPAPCLPG